MLKYGMREVKNENNLNNSILLGKQYYLSILVISSTVYFLACGGDVIRTEGNLKSPGFDGLTKYKPFLDVCWIIEAPKGQVDTINDN